MVSVPRSNACHFHPHPVQSHQLNPISRSIRQRHVTQFLRQTVVSCVTPRAADNTPPLATPAHRSAPLERGSAPPSLQHVLILVMHCVPSEVNASPIERAALVSILMECVYRRYRIHPGMRRTGCHPHLNSTQTDIHTESQSLKTRTPCCQPKSTRRRVFNRVNTVQQ